MRVALVLGSVVVSCASSPPPDEEAPESGQSYTQALQLICDVDRLSGASPDDPLEQSRVREDYLLEHVKNPDGIYFLTLFRTKGEKEQSQLLSEETQAKGLKRCPLLGALEGEA